MTLTKMPRKPRCRACHRRPVSVDLYCSRCLETGRANKRPPPPKPERVHVVADKYSNFFKIKDQENGLGFR